MTQKMTLGTKERKRQKKPALTWVTHWNELKTQNGLGCISSLNANEVAIALLRQFKIYDRYAKEEDAAFKHRMVEARKNDDNQ